MPVFSSEILYRVIEHWDYDNQEVINTWFYVDVSPSMPDPLATYIQEFRDSNIIPRLPLLNAAAVLTHIQMTKIQIGAFDQIVDIAQTGFVGTLAGEPLASINAVGVRMNVTDNSTRPGQKRFCSTSETQVTGNKLSSSAIAAWTAYIPDMVAPIVTGTGDTLALCVVKTTETVFGVTSQLPRNQWVYNLVVGGVVKANIRPQTSRKTPSV